LVKNNIASSKRENVDNYFIKKGYKINQSSINGAKEYQDYEQSSAKFQLRVYRYAAKVVKKYKIESVLDIGCGHGYKLRKYLSPLCSDIVGIDKNHSIDYCRKMYDFGNWYPDDIEDTKIALDRKFGMIISSDVIEHLSDPDCLLDYIKRYSSDKTWIIISTPERDRLSNVNMNGPPINPYHVREWNRLEFSAYLSNRGFEIMQHRMAGDYQLNFYQVLKKIALGRYVKTIQVLVCRYRNCRSGTNSNTKLPNV